MQARSDPRGGRRGGAALIVALVSLVLVIALIGAMARTTLARRQKALSDERRLQASWLAESGLERAWARLGAEPGYRGEEWIVPAEELGSADAGRVVISVEEIPGEAGKKRVRVSADYPRAEERRARQTRSVEFESGGDAPGDRR